MIRDEITAGVFVVVCAGIGAVIGLAVRWGTLSGIGATVAVLVWVCSIGIAFGAGYAQAVAEQQEEDERRHVLGGGHEHE